LEIKRYATQYGAEAEFSARRVARHFTLSSLAGLYRLTGRLSSLRRNRVQFVYLHHLFPEEEASFRKILRALSRTHTFLSHSQAVDRLREGRIDKPYLSFSFDDGLKNCLRAAAILEEFGTSGCFFVCPSIVGETDYLRLREICARSFSMPPTDVLDWDDVESLVRAGHEIGGHTMTHPVLSQVSRERLLSEIGETRERLTRRLGGVKHFAWPKGRFFHFSPEAAKAVFDAGFQTCASAERGCHITQPGPLRSGLCLRRDYISARWPWGHVAYFLATNGQTASPKNNQWPDGWFEQIHSALDHG
jgi:peptidoglycan/xylan/chitin deacetylase (PgdA/CDA1 family)